jgi:hypothetical protein
MSNSHIYISLGWNCSPRYYIRDIGMSRSNGYRSCPFDLCMTSFAGLCKCIETDFKYFFNDLALIPGGNAEGDRSKCGVGGINITNHYQMIFNHEGSTHSHLFKDGINDDLFYIRNDFEQFRNRYEIRIQNYNKYISENHNITFVYRNHNNEYDVILLHQLLREKYPNKNINILEI